MLNMLNPTVTVSKQNSKLPISTSITEKKAATTLESIHSGKKKRYLKHQSKHGNLNDHLKNAYKTNSSAEPIFNPKKISIQDRSTKWKMVCNEVVAYSQISSKGKLYQGDFSSRESNDVEQFRIRSKRKRSFSYPGGTFCNNQDSSACLSSSASSECLFTETCDLHKITNDAIQEKHCEQSCNQSSDINSCNAPVVNVSPSVESLSLSRRSSTSTVRERNNSIDSAISQMSIIDISELDDVYAQNSDSNSSAWKVQHSRSKSDASCGSTSNHIEVEEFSDISFSSSFPSSLSENASFKKKSIFEGNQMAVPTECFFPRPQQGQSLTSFLSSNEFNIRAELDRENAHFCIAEAMISAIERIKCAKTSKIVQYDEESDEEIRDLTQRIRIRRKERQREKVRKTFVFWNDGRPDTTTSQSASPPLSSHSSDYEVDSIGSEDEIEDMELSDRTESNLSSMKENGLSLSMASLYSDADIQKVPSSKETANKKFHDSEASNVSAESVALALLRRFSEKQLPKASELEWLVSEKEANGQRLLPLPDSWPISPDTIEEEFSSEKIRLRGNLDWAPPRPQIIFIIHPLVKRKALIEKQKYQCAGCGMKIEHSYISRFRYCNYFGKYFCQCCHSNDQAYIPGHILWKWDFTKYYVSKLAWNLVDQMFLDPLFYIIDINANLYKKVKQLEQCRMYRMQLFYIKDFIRTCRTAEDIQMKMQQFSSHIFSEPHKYSLSDFVQVRNGEMSKILYQLINFCTSHIKRCPLCQAKGFICEICNKASDIIYPFQLDKVVLCENCGSCFHKRCYKAGVCPRCVRIMKRRSIQCETEILNNENEICV